jgi:penicillin-binding protein 1A
VSSKIKAVQFVRPFLLFIFFSVAAVFGVAVALLHIHHIDISLFDKHGGGNPSILLDDEGNEWARFSLDKRRPISLDQLPAHVIDAFIAAEDHDFFSHAGVSMRGILRSCLVNAYHGKIVQGASTITQQLVKLLFFDSQKTISRKIKEQAYALILERQLSKEQIIQTYLNHVYFGCGIYGIEAASQRFWGISATALSLSQAAMLAAIVKSPNQYCPLLFPLSAQRRRNVILASMLKLQLIGHEDYQAAKNEPVTIEHENEQQLAPYFKEAVRQQVEELVGRQQLYAGGLVIQTTLNSNMQLLAEAALRKNIETLRKKIMPELNGALLCMRVADGQIKTMVGGYDFAQSQFNRAIQAKRQLGSIFKPIVYAAALHAGIHFGQTELDEPLEIPQANGVWQPRNFSRHFEGEITLARALSRSNNIVTIKTLLKVGFKPVIDLAKKFGIRAELLPYPSLALGCVDVSLQEATGLFNVFANSGIYVQPHIIRWIKNSVGEKIYKEYVVQDRVIPAMYNTQMCKVLGLNMDRLKKRYPDSAFSGKGIFKTGTTNDSRTCWFVGSTPGYTTGLYIGCDDNRALGENIFASSTLFPCWVDFNQQILGGKQDFIYDSNGLRLVTIDSKSGITTSTVNPDAISIFVPA